MIYTVYKHRLRSPLRSLAVGSGSMMCRVGSVVAPFCVYLADVWIYLPQARTHTVFFTGLNNPFK